MTKNGHAPNHFKHHDTNEAQLDPLWQKVLDFGLAKQADGFQDDVPQKYVRVDNQGDAQLVTLDRHEIVAQLGIRYRDLIAISPNILYPSPASILIRERAILANLEATRLIISAHECYVLSLPKANDPGVATLPTLDHPFVKHLASLLKEEPEACAKVRKPGVHDDGRGGGTPPRSPSTPKLEAKHAEMVCRESMPFELRALEASLRVCFAVFESEVSALEERAYTAVDNLLKQIGREVLDNVRGEKNAVDRMRVRLGTVQREVDEILSDDLDMADLYLSRREEERPPCEEDHFAPPMYHTTSESEAGSVAGSITSIAEPSVSGRSTDGNGGAPLGRSDKGSGLEGSGGQFEGRGSYLKLPLDDVSHHESHQQQQQHKRYRAGGRRRERHQRRFAAQGEVGGGGDDGEGSEAGMSWTSDGGFQVHPDDIQEAEDLLESFHIYADALLHRLGLIDERIDDTEDLLEIELDHRRNQIFTLNLVVSTVSMSFGWFAAIGGFFGMNLFNSRWDNSMAVFFVVMGVMLGGSVALIAATLVYVKRRGLLFIPT